MALSPDPRPSMARPPESSSMLEIALAVTTRWRVWGFVTRGPSRMREVSRGARERATYSSRKTDCESATPRRSNPASSASRHRFPKSPSDSGRNTMPNRAPALVMVPSRLMARSLRGCGPSGPYHAPARARAARRGASSLPLTYSQTQEQIPGHHLGDLSRGPVEHSLDEEGGQAVDAGPRGEGKILRRLLRAHESGALAIHDGGDDHGERVTGDLTKSRK